MDFFKKAREVYAPVKNTGLYPSVFLIRDLPRSSLWFDDEGWLQSDSSWSVEHRPLRALKWDGMHPVLQKDYGNRFLGIITHYTALGDGRRTADRFHGHDRAKLNGKKYRSVSTHFIVCRDGHIIQLASIKDRTWHAARKGLKFEVPAARGNPERTSTNPNHWFVGLDLANWGKLKGISRQKKTWTGQIFKGPEFQRGNTWWEDYTLAQVEAYVALNESLVTELGIQRDCQFGHEDIDPGRKIDPGPALQFSSLLDRIYDSSALTDEDSEYFKSRSGLEAEV